MPVPTNQANIHIGPGNIWLGTTVPAEGNTVPLTNGQPSTGTFIGATTKGANWVYHPTELDLMIEQSTLPMDIRCTTEDVRIDFAVAEVVYAVLKQVVGGAFDKGTFIAIGGLAAIAQQSLLLVSPKRDGKYVEAMIYLAAFVGDRNFPFARSAWSEIPVTARAIAVTTRTLGDQGGFLHTSITSA